MYISNKKGFTLVELIVVVVILTILGAIGLVSYSNSLVTTRDTTRISALVNISEGLMSYTTRKSTLPTPENATEILSGTQRIGFQGEATPNILDIIGLDSTKWTDPKNKTPYVYYTDKAKNYHQLMAFLEDSQNLETFNRSILLPPVYAADYSDRFPTIYGDKLGIILDNDTNNPITQDTVSSLNISGAPSGYKIFFDTGIETRPDNAGFDSQAYANTVRNGGVFDDCIKLDDKKNLRGNDDYIFSSGGVVIQSCSKGAITGAAVVIGN